MELRHPTDDEREEVAALVQTVVNEVYGKIVPILSLPIGVTDWSSAWVAVDESGLAGVVLSSGEWVEDLWVAAKSRGSGVGSALLKLCEAEIRERGINCARLRVVGTNIGAIRFYKARGWTIEREYQHESWPVLILDMVKVL